MRLLHDLARALLETHPDDAAAVLERMPPAEAARALAAAAPGVAAEVLRRTAPHAGAATLAELPLDRSAAVAEAFPIEVAAGLLRRLDAEKRDELVGALPERHARSLRTVLAHDEGSAGALLDPHALALPDDLRAEDALRELRGAAGNVLFNLYVVDREHALVGVLNLRELLQAEPTARLGALARPATHRVRAGADRATILAHPGWREVHSLPVVDARGTFLGALRESTFLHLAREAQERGGAPEPTAALALGELFRTGVVGILDAFAVASDRARRA